MPPQRQSQLRGRSGRGQDQPPAPTSNRIAHRNTPSLATARSRTSRRSAAMMGLVDGLGRSDDGNASVRKPLLKLKSSSFFIVFMTLCFLPPPTVVIRARRTCCSPGPKHASPRSVAPRSHPPSSTAAAASQGTASPRFPRVGSCHPPTPRTRTLCSRQKSSGGSRGKEAKAQVGKALEELVLVPDSNGLTVAHGE